MSIVCRASCNYHVFIIVTEEDFTNSLSVQVVIETNRIEGCNMVHVAEDFLFEGNETFNISIVDSNPFLIINTPPASCVTVDNDSE